MPCLVTGFSGKGSTAISSHVAGARYCALDRGVSPRRAPVVRAARTLRRRPGRRHALLAAFRVPRAHRRRGPRGRSHVRDALGADRGRPPVSGAPPADLRGRPAGVSVLLARPIGPCRDRPSHLDRRAHGAHSARARWKARHRPSRGAGVEVSTYRPHSDSRRHCVHTCRMATASVVLRARPFLKASGAAKRFRLASNTPARAGSIGLRRRLAVRHRRIAGWWGRCPPASDPRSCLASPPHSVAAPPASTASSVTSGTPR